MMRSKAQTTESPVSLLKAEKPSVQPEPRLANSGSSRTTNQPLKVPAHQVMGTTEVWETFHAQLRAFIGARVGASADADDILQNVFVKIHTHIHTLRKQDRLATWVYQITRNAIIDSYRARHPHQSMPAELGAWDAPQESDPATQIGEYLRILVNGLAPKYRTAIILAEYNGLTSEELGRRLGLSVSGAKSRLQRARSQLRKQLLDCCRFEFDHAGNLLDYEPNPNCCAECLPV
ncbi:MAG: RNA polymerase sigma factor SigZ [Chloroflexi bacterium]|nr:MAG: RNA polymerase sigma factor SigZ [Chloroflexota bacterium]